MRILWIPQISSLSKDCKVLLNKDSNMAVLRNMINSDFGKENEIIVAFEFNKENCVGYEDLQGVKNIELYFNSERDFTNAKMERYAFDIKYYNFIYNYHEDAKRKFDIIFTNEPTKVVPLKEIFKGSKVVTYNHWLAFENMPEIELRQFEGMVASDMCFLNSDYAMDNIIGYYDGFRQLRQLKNKMVKLQPAFDSKVCNLKTNAKKNFIYNHRLSSDIYYKDAFDSLLNICTYMEEQIGEENMPIIYFTNPSGKDFKVKDIKPYFKQIELGSKEEYEDFLRSDEIAGHINTFFNSRGMWSMSTVDCAVAGNVCFLPNKFGYAEIFDDTYSGYCASSFQMAHLIIAFLQNENPMSFIECKKDIEKHSCKNIGSKLNKLLLSLLH